MAHNPDALGKTLADVKAQLADARDRGDFILADELHGKLTGLKASVAEAREDIVDGKFKYECSILEQQRQRETGTVTRGMRRMENDVNMHIEARVADLEVRGRVRRIRARAFMCWKLQLMSLFLRVCTANPPTGAHRARTTSARQSPTRVHADSRDADTEGSCRAPAAVAGLQQG
jgi:hypothetical protein